MNLDKDEFIESMRERTKNVAIEVLKLCESLNQGNNSLRVIAYQLAKSATSTAANYRAACRGRSNKEFYSKMSITVEEADETVFWLEVWYF